MTPLYWVEYNKTNVHGWGTGLVHVSQPFDSKGIVDDDQLHMLLLDTHTTVKKILRIHAHDVTAVYLAHAPEPPQTEPQAQEEAKTGEAEESGPTKGNKE